MDKATDEKANVGVAWANPEELGYHAISGGAQNRLTNSNRTCTVGMRAGASGFDDC